MPLEIREMIIKAVIEAEGGKTSGSGGSSQAGVNDTDPQQIIVNLCVEKVLEILKEKQER